MASIQVGRQTSAGLGAKIIKKSQWPKHQGEIDFPHYKHYVSSRIESMRKQSQSNYILGHTKCMEECLRLIGISNRLVKPHDASQDDGRTEHGRWQRHQRLKGSGRSGRQDQPCVQMEWWCVWFTMAMPFMATFITTVVPHGDHWNYQWILPLPNSNPYWHLTTHNFIHRHFTLFFEWANWTSVTLTLGAFIYDPNKISL